MPSGHMARQNVDTHQEGYVPTTIKATQLAQLKAKRDTTIIGSTVSGKKVEVDTGHDLHMQSLQDVDNFKEHSKSAGFSVSSKPNFKDPTGSISASVGSKGKASSTTQSAISDGILTVDGKEIDTRTINTNTENTLHQLDKIFDKKKIEERQELARLFAKNAFEEVHRLSDKYHWKEGGPEKVALHAAIGEITAQLAGNPNGSGAVAAGINELAIKKIIDKVGKDHPDQAQILSAVLGATVNKAIDKSGNSGAAVSNYGTKWNKEYVPVEWSERAINNFADYIRDSMSEADQAKLNLELAAGTTATIAFLTVWSQKNAPEVLALVAEGTTEMIVLNAEIVGTVNEFYDVFKAAWESRTNIWERLNNYPNYNRNKIEKMKENPWDYE